MNKNFKDITGTFLTQALFLELEYKPEFAMYTLKDEDHEYKGVLYPSIKRLYLECEDVTEYEFANKYFASWSHWKRLQKNARIADHISDWREELEVKLRAQAIRNIIDQTTSDSQGSFQAAKWLADRGWDKRAAGRPSKVEKEKEDRIKDRVSAEYLAEVTRMSDYKGNK